MKRFVSLCAAALLCAAVAPASAQIFTLPQSAMLDATNFVDLDGPSPYTPNTGTLWGRSALGAGARYDITLDGSSGWSSIQLGDGFDHPSNNAGLTVGGGTMGGDLTGFTSYQIRVSNPNVNGPWFMANLDINTGWTDSPWSEPDNYYQNSWIWIAPGTSQLLTLDLTGVANLNHVSQIGLQIGANVTGDESWNPQMAQGVHFNVDVAPVPEPGTLVMLGLGLMASAGIRFRRRSRD